MGRQTGDKITDIPVAAIRDRLAELPADGRAVARLVAAREYKDGRSPNAIERKYGWPRGTVYHWLDRFEARGLDGGLEDRAPPGRPPKLDADDRARLASILADTPRSAGYEAAGWSTELVRRVIRETFGVTYSNRHVRRLLDDIDEG